MDPLQHGLLDTSVEERREGRLIHQGEGDDSFLSALADIDGEELAEALDDDEKLAQVLQLQEVLMASTESAKPRIETGEPLAPSLPCCCEICRRQMPSPEIFRATACSHALCRACSDQYIEEELQKDDASSVKCPRATCDLVLEPEPYRDFVRPEVFDRWLDAHQRGDQKKSIVLVERRPSVEQVKDPIFHVSIQGEFDRRQLLKLTDTLLDAVAAPGDGPGNPKGKHPVEFPHFVTEIGQSSSASSQVVDEFYCAICMEPKPLHESFDINGCSHRFCMGCASLYVTAKVGENSIMIGCPDPGCKDGNLEPEMCRSILPGEVFDRWGVVLCESALGTAKFYCPYKDCSALLFKEGGNGDEQAMRDAECPHCKRVLCARCSVPWHDGIDCEQYQQLEEDERGREDLMLRQLANRSRWQRCPKCKIYVEKIEGCSFMSCRYCLPNSLMTNSLVCVSHSAAIFASLFDFLIFYISYKRWHDVIY